MDERDEEYELALQVVDLAKALIVSDNHFLSAAIGQLVPAKASFGRSLATDARFLYIDPRNLLVQFMQDGEPPKRDLLHTILHCVFLHPFVDIEIRQDDWNLACDIAVELLVMQICGPRSHPRGADIEHAIRKVATKVNGPITAERVYALLREGAFETERPSWKGLFEVDEHAVWYASRNRDGNDEGVEAEAADAQDTEVETGDSAGNAGGGSVEGETLHGDGSGSSPISEPDDQELRDEEGDGSSPDGSERMQGTGTGSDQMGVSAGERMLPEMRMTRDASLEQAWRKVGKSMSVDLRTISKKLGSSMDALLEGLDEANRQTVDYREFLRKFAVPSEVMRVSPDEFDTIFYTYGLSLYENMPLIEPLENRIDKRIRDFVIAIDTSGSVYGEQVRNFVALTYDVLKSTETFDERVRVKIMQCDTKIRHIDEVDSLEEIKRWCGQMAIYGGGGTDFRPVFECVDKMIDEGELRELGGLIYFTDGYGTYPEWVPDYKTAFVFCDEDHREEIVPPWAMQVVMEPKQLEGIDWRDSWDDGTGDDEAADMDMAES